MSKFEFVDRLFHVIGFRLNLNDNPLNCDFKSYHLVLKITKECVKTSNSSIYTII